MPFKVKEILLVANLYDAFSIEREGRFSDHIIGEYYRLNLTSMPRVTSVSSEEETFERLKSRHFDLIILMFGVDKKTPLKLCRKIKEKYPYIPTFFLLNNSNDIPLIEAEKKKSLPFDRYFVWTGESNIFFAMVKLLEDKVNVENDTKVGFTRVILLVEDSSDYYSRYLPMLYRLVLEQTKRLIEDVGTDEFYKVLKLRARPKILLAVNFEEALTVINKYKNFLLCVISDVRFPRDGKLDENAGFNLIRFVKKELKNLPTVLQSHDPSNVKYARKLNSTFINKNSETLFQDLKSFINYYLGFGHFVYRDNQGRQIAVAKSMKEFESYLKTIPEDSLIYHAMKNHFSLWLMARGEVEIAKIINPVKISDFKNLKELREFLISIIRKRRKEQERGKIVTFEELSIVDESNIVSLAAGSLGGKGRGLAFVNTLIYNFDFVQLTPHINIKTPITLIIGTDEFDIFLKRNHLYEKLQNEQDYEKIKQLFLKSSISYSLEKKLRILLKLITKPIAIRSSSLFEDSMAQPFSGVFGTYILPNNHSDFNVRFKQAADAIKMVYASIYSKNARTYFKVINYNIDQEKMAIVLQEVVGNQYGDYFYPHISGTAQSHNYYPVAHMQPEEGFAVAAVGLGQYVVAGEKAHRFSPSYPRIEISATNEQVRNSQVDFYAVNMGKKDVDLLEGENAGLIKLDISESEKHGTLIHCASVYNSGNDSIIPGLDIIGPRVINFANILKYDYIPLAQTIRFILDILKEALGSPVEIEYAVNLNKDKNGRASFYMLQIKPLMGTDIDHKIDLDKMEKDKILLYSERSMGNGIIENIYDVIFIDKNKFDKTSTLEMTTEIESLNQKMLDTKHNYILIGPGRWGTRDRFIGIPVAWPQISNAKVIVEMSTKDFPLDASLGSHFFHNLTSMNIGYFSVNHTSRGNFIRWDVLEKQKLVNKTKYFRHVRFNKPLKIIMDGKKRKSLITW
ncbi:MAG: pyruvate, phosphate dikinase [Bacteroidetes bacterium]|nr:pyruvate, phosphate dikinase [Bacteroidota bacterium]